jgi:bifunctional oligoribonuclease and PAP phosphatase NrnA
MPVNWPQFVEIVRSHQRFLITSHIRPDCDALGSELGMALILESLGKQVTIVNGHATPPNLLFVDVQPDQLKEIDVFMVLDTSAWAQLGPMGDVLRASKAIKLTLDHHVGEDDLGTLWFKDTQAEAAGRLVIEAAENLGVKLTPEMARPLFAAISTDTGWFRFNSTSGNTMRFAGKLVDAGAVPSEIYSELYERDTLARLKLRGRIIARTQTELDGRLAWTAVHRVDFEETGALPSDTEDVINLTLSIGGTEVAVIFVEQATGGFKLSFRSRTPKVDCNVLAKQFGGGGHKAAAGAFISEPFESAKTKVLDAVRAAMR